MKKLLFLILISLFCKSPSDSPPSKVNVELRFFISIDSISDCDVYAEGELIAVLSEGENQNVKVVDGIEMKASWINYEIGNGLTITRTKNAYEGLSWYIR